MSEKMESTGANNDDPGNVKDGVGTPEVSATKVETSPAINSGTDSTTAGGKVDDHNHGEDVNNNNDSHDDVVDVDINDDYNEDEGEDDGGETSKLIGSSNTDSNVDENGLGPTIEVGKNNIENIEDTQKSNGSRMEKLEIDQGGFDGSNKNEEEEVNEDDDDEEDADVQLERLLGESGSPARRTKKQQHNKKKKRSLCGCCSSANYRKIGNFTIICPKLYSQYGFGVAGVHWWGPFFTCGIILWASEYFIRKAFNNVGMLTGIVCICLTVSCIVLLFLTSFSNPGIVTTATIEEQTTSKQGTSNTRTSRGDWRWCDFCNVYQPPTGAHCPDCNVCIDRYDHHCVWMGTCIGRGNLRYFTRFNLCWLGYLVYSIIWILIIGPHTKHK